MACPSKSAEDPLFWIHHANIDRLWQKWLNMGEGRADPDSIANAFWWNKTFKFYDSSGIVKIFKGKDVIKIADLLHVEYDDVPLPNVYPSKRDKKHPLSAAQKAIIVSDLNGVTIPSSGARMQFGQANSNTNQRRTIQSKIPQNSKPNPSKKDSVKNIYIEFENITIANNSSGTIEIYLNPEFVKQLNYENEHFLGILDLFTAQAINDHLKSNHEQSALKINITPVVNRLGLSFEDLKQSEIIFINRGENINGKENQSKLVVSIGKISLVTYGID
ncbi:MAG: tyrosinase family protein [Chitinophagaceae bacterium]|nr:tyrosinase family protein [Chitinophagaceae bacterium]